MSTNAPKQQQQYARDPRYQAQYARKVVLDYLHKHGYKAAEKELNADSKDQDADAMYDDESRNAVMMLNRATRGFEDQPAMYEEMYKELRDWVDGSLDMYKGELHSVLYPHLVHCFLEMVRRGASRSARRFLERYGNEFLAHSEKRAEELRTLMGVTTPQIMSENETAKLFLNNRYELYLSSYALELLLAFLTDNPRRYLLLRILNHKCRIIDQTIPSAANGVEEKTGFFASQEQNALLHKGVLWGRLKEEEYIIADDTGEKEKEEEEEDDEAKDKAPQVEPDGTL